MDLTLRELAAIGVAFLVGAGLTINTVIGVRDQRALPEVGRRRAWIDTVARLLFGGSVALLAMWTLAGHTVWHGGQDNTIPTWAAPLGLALVLVCGIAGLVSAGCFVWRRVHVRQR